MSWFTRQREALGLGPKRDTPSDLWHKCLNCGQLTFAKEFRAALQVCPHCGHHHRIGPAERFAQLFDPGSLRRLPLPPAPEDPLRFRDTKRYSERLRAARASVGEHDAMAVAQGRIESLPAVLAVQNFAFMGGSMGAAVGGAVVAGAMAAVEARAPFVVITASGGARMQEGTLSLMQLPRTTAAVMALNDAGLPYVVVLADPTTGGVTASFAMLGDVILAEPKALIGFAGPRVIAQTIRQELPEGFQRSEYLLKAGMVDRVVPRAQLRNEIARLIDYAG
jgi:acetyl-CoA carboxylase carboxyl transferase subunit beta